jgi:hypothetical protein
LAIQEYCTGSAVDQGPNDDSRFLPGKGERYCRQRQRPARCILTLVWGIILQKSDLPAHLLYVQWRRPPPRRTMLGRKKLHGCIWASSSRTESIPVKWKPSIMHTSKIMFFLPSSRRDQIRGKFTSPILQTVSSACVFVPLFGPLVGTLGNHQIQHAVA